MASFNVIDRGLEEISETLYFQEQLVSEKVRDGSIQDTLILVEHKPVFTGGRGTEFAQTGFVLAEDVPWMEINRGGQVTFHGPGQLVVYPVFDLTQLAEGGGRRDVHVFLRKVEEAIIIALRSCGIYSFQREGLTGVWVKTPSGDLKKIASIGIGLRKWISYHGLALNLTTDLDYFKAINPCGQSAEVMTSIAEISKLEGIACPSMPELKAFLTNAFNQVFVQSSEENATQLHPEEPAKLVRPSWLKVRAPGSPEFSETRQIVKELRLNTVCEEARCPNIGECWSHHTATFMILGDLCTRRCNFCSVKDGTISNLQELDPLEPRRVAVAIEKLGLEHVVITSVNRDDLEDMGADHFDRTVRAIRAANPDCRIELLIPDMRGRRELVQQILESGYVDVLNHNVETVPRLYRRVRPGANLKRSLNILRFAKELWPEIKTKSGLMVGLGETREEVLEVMDGLRENGVDILTIGQYLQPSPKQLAVERFVTPEEFEDYRREGEKRGFAFVESAPLVRSSYHAWKHTEGAERATAVGDSIATTTPASN